MKITFFSNYLNHHQIPLAEAFYRTPGVDYTFVASTPMNPARAKLGYREENYSHPYVLTTYDSAENAEKARKLAVESDLVITGSAPEEYSRLRIRSGKPLFRYSERPLKAADPVQHAKTALHLRWRNPPFSKVYVLAASAYTAGDYARMGLFRGRCFKWGYFPEVRRYADFASVLGGKEEASILWCGRFLNWKHPEAAVQAARTLREEGCRFRLRMIGVGEEETRVRRLAEEAGLADTVSFLGAMSPEEVRQEMERSGIFLFTSDRNEGWGAVLNEAMNSGCAAVASRAIGSAPFLLQNGENGLLYRDGDVEDLTNAVRRLLNEPETCERLGRAAYRTLTDQWNAGNAASRLLALNEHLLSGGDGRLFADGVCSMAEPL